MSRWIAWAALILITAVSAAAQISPEELEQVRKGAKAGDAQMQLTLGMLYYSGQGVDQDPKLAAKWFRKARRESPGRDNF